jgi:uracil-DNA glycosylase
MFLEPLGISRYEAWLCDLVPHSCSNPSQKRAIEREYTPLIQKHALPLPSVPNLPHILADEKRRAEISAELARSEAEVLILLGDLPIKWFLAYFDTRWRKLSDFNLTADAYGNLHKTHAFGRDLSILPLVHPRQAGRLGASSEMWGKLHQDWMQTKARHVL